MVDPGSIIKKCIVFFTPRGQSGTHFEFARANSIMVFRYENFTVGGLKVMSEKVKNEPMFTKFIYISIYIYISIIIIYIHVYVYVFFTCSQRIFQSQKIGPQDHPGPVRKTNLPGLERTAN